MQSDSDTGKCVDVKDRGLLSFNRLHRSASWGELNPGRPERPKSRLGLSIKPNDDRLKVIMERGFYNCMQT